MQRTQEGGVIISCDFCGADWDPRTGLPFMSEGHHGSVICLECLKLALQSAVPQAAAYSCTLCLQEIPATVPAFRNAARPAAVACEDCLQQARRVFSRDPDVGFKG